MAQLQVLNACEIEGSVTYHYSMEYHVRKKFMDIFIRLHTI